MDEIARMLMELLVVPIVSGLLVSLAAWVVSKLPGPIRDALTANVHRKDVDLITEAMARRAVVIAAGTLPTSTPVTDVLNYVRQALPQVTAKVGASDEAMRTMAMAALAQAEAGRKAGP